MAAGAKILGGLVVGVLLGSLSLSAFGQEGKSPAILRTQVVTQPPDAGWFSSLRKWLGAQVIRPAVGTRFTVISTGYAPSIYQTDATPCINAAGETVREGTAATNFLPFGTLFRIHGIKDFENKVFIVEDRMNSRYGTGFLDLYFTHTSDALQHGRRKIAIEVVGYGVPGQELPGAEGTGEATVVKRASSRFVAFTHRLSSLLRTKITGDVNRFDKKCPLPTPSPITETE